MRFALPVLLFLILLMPVFAQEEPAQQAPPDSPAPAETSAEAAPVDTSTPEGMVKIPEGNIRLVFEGQSRWVDVASFFMDKREVTNAEYNRCVEAGACRRYRKKIVDNVDAPELPAVDVSPLDAKTYCQWAGKSLPTEGQYVLAARSADNNKLYPWGSGRADGKVNFVLGAPFTEGNKTYRFATPPCSFIHGSTPEGICDLAGNVAEWLIAFDPYDATGKSNRFVTRGGSFLSPAVDLRIDSHSEKQHMLSRNFDVGFRCVKESQ